MSEPCILVRLQYLYPHIDRTFFRAREFGLSGAEIARTGLFGHAPDIAGVVIAADSMHIQFNERDFFSGADQSALGFEFLPGRTFPGPVWIADHGGFELVPKLRSNARGFQISLAGREVTENHYIRLEWQLQDSRA